MTTAIIYTRFSRSRNSDKSESCETQQAYCEQRAADKEWEIGQVFEDRGISGGDEDRPLLWAAIEALEPGDVLLVFKLDRLARNVYLSECIRRAVEKIGARIEAVNGDIEGDGPEQVMIRQVLASIAEYERKVIAIRTKYAMLYHQKNGRRMGRYAPYGMMIKPSNHKLIVPCKYELPAVNRISTLAREGKTIHEIVVLMNREYFEMARGKVGWTQKSIKKIISRLPMGSDIKEVLTAYKNPTKSKEIG